MPSSGVKERSDGASTGKLCPGVMPGVMSILGLAAPPSEIKGVTAGRKFGMLAIMVSSGVIIVKVKLELAAPG